MKLSPTALTAIALALAAQGAGAQTRPACPPNMSAVSSGPFGAVSCVGSPTQGLVESTLPFSATTMFGALPVAPEKSTVWASPERPALPDREGYEPGNADWAASHTFGSAPDAASYGIPNKLAADWAFLFDGDEPAAGQPMAWMGGTLSRGLDGSLSFHPGYGAAPSFPIGRYRSDIRGFLAAAGPLTAQAVSRRYGLSLSGDLSAQSRAYGQWRRAMDLRHAPGSHALIGQVGPDGAYATVVFGSGGRPASVYDSHGERIAPSEFESSPDFTAITGHGVAWSR